MGSCSGILELPPQGGIHSSDSESQQQCSAIATCIALSYSRAQANPTVERGPPCQKAKVNKPSAEKTKAKASDAQHKDK